MYIRHSNLVFSKAISGALICFIFVLTLSHRVMAEDDVDRLKQDLLELERTANPFVQIFQKVSSLVGPSVVSIVAENASDNPINPHGIVPFPLFMPEERNKEMPYHFRPSFGSGVIVKKAGYILTNLHVIDGFENGVITVTLHNGDAYEAKIIGKDPNTDMAILKIECDNLREATFGDPKNIMVGDWVIAIGSPFGYSQTVSSGIVSAIGRTNVTPYLKPFAYENFIQTDAAINPGNSGGPLVNLLGQVIGINSAIATRSGGFQGVGFAISVEIANEVISDLIEKGRVMRGYLGVGIRDIDDGLALYLNLISKNDVLRKFNLDSVKGAFISEVWDNTPASRGGFFPGDVIVEFDSNVISNADDLQKAIRSSIVGNEVGINVIRNKKVKTLVVKIDEQPVNMSGRMFLSVKDSIEKTGNNSGLTVESLTPDKAIEMGYEIGRGVVVKHVESNSPAERAGLLPGDLILRIGPEDVNTAEEFRAVMRKFEDNGISVAVWTKTKGIVNLK